MKTPPLRYLLPFFLTFFLATGLFSKELVVNTTQDYSDLSCEDGNCTLRDAIALADFNDTVFISEPGTITLHDEISISKSIHIKGKSPYESILSSDHGSKRIFTIDPLLQGDLNVSIENLGFKGIRTGIINGAVLYIHAENTVHITKSLFEDNTAEQSAGAIYNDHSRLILTDTVFTANSSATSQGGAIYNHFGQLELYNTSFLQNSATEAGGAIYNESGQIDANNTHFSKNFSIHGDGGALYLSSGKTGLRHSKLTQNSADNGNGGALFCANCELESNQSIFGENGAFGYGGAVVLQSPIDSVRFNDVTFHANQVHSSIASRGGAMDISGGKVALTRTTFSQNRSSGFEERTGGGAVSLAGADSHLIISSSEFSANHTSGFGGALFITQSATYEQSDSNLTYNSADKGGGALYAHTGELRITDSHLSENKANDTAQGGALLLDNSKLECVNSALTSNTAMDGGAVKTMQSRLDIRLSSLERNEVQGNGAAIFSEANNTIRIENSTLSTNNAYERGGGIALFQDNSQITVLNSSITHNTAHSGAGISADDNNSRSRFQIENSTIARNQASLKAGAIHWNAPNGEMHLLSATITRNNAAYSDGGILSQTPTLSLSNTILAENGTLGTENCTGFLVSEDYNFIGNTSDCEITGESEHNILDDKAYLLERDINTTHYFMPSVKSPVIDRGSCQKGKTKDQLGTERPQGEACDIGAIEYIPTPIFTYTLTKGWNLISLPTLTEFDKTMMMKSFSLPSIKGIYKYDSIFAKWKSWQRTELKTADSFTTLSFKDPVWIDVAEDTAVEYYFDAEDINASDKNRDSELLNSLFAKWTLMGFHTELKAHEAIALINGKKINATLNKKVALMLKFNNRLKRWEIYTTGSTDPGAIRLDIPTLQKHLNSTDPSLPELKNLSTLPRFDSISRHEAVWVRTQ